MPTISIPTRTSDVRTIDDLVTEGWKLDAQIKRDLERLREIKNVLIKAGAGRYPGRSGGEALVVFPGPKIETPKEEKKLSELRTDILGADDFKTLFERIISWRPVKSCRDVAVRVLTPVRLKKFLALCEIETSAQVRFG